MAVSSVGCMNSREGLALFCSGYDEMIRRLCPETVIFYGEIPAECRGNIVRIKAFQDKFSEATLDEW